MRKYFTPLARENVLRRKLIYKHYLFMVRVHRAFPWFPTRIEESALKGVR